MRARDEQRQAQSERDAAARTAAHDPAQERAGQDTLARRQTAAAKALEEATSAAAEARARVSTAIASLGEWSDPRRSLARLADDLPILLLPLRLETRFKDVAGADGASHELWVRVYPDYVSRRRVRADAVRVRGRNRKNVLAGNLARRRS